MTNNPFLNTDWMESQRKIWQTWTDVGLNAMSNKAIATSPWENAMNHWWSTLSPTAPDASKQFMDKLMEQSKLFMKMTDELYRKMGTGGGVEDWNTLVQKTFIAPFGKLSANQDEQNEAMRRMLAFWEMPLDTWQRMVSSMSLLPGDALRNMHHEHLLKDNLQRLLSAPGLGYTREQQGKYNELAKQALQYQTALYDYMQFFSKVGLQSSERMQQRLTELSNSGTVIDTAHGLYDLWVDCCESIYAEQVMTHEYAMLYSKLINTLMAFKHRLTIIVDESLGAMNMPTRAELHTLQDRLQETRRENKRLRHDIEELKTLVAALG
jgi:class III poly(R)-hydroxyalkanoic acid synthase PhaE subunit